MLELHGHDAAIMAVAKGRLRQAGNTWLDQLKVAAAAVAGLPWPGDVETGDVVQMVAALLDRLVASGLVRNPAAAMVNAMRLHDTGNLVRGVRPSSSQALLDAMMATIQCVSVLDPEGQTLVAWQSGLPKDFDETVRRLGKQGRQ